MKRFFLVIIVLIIGATVDAQPVTYTGEIPEFLMAHQQANDSIFKQAKVSRASINRSDTIDILHYSVSLNVTDFTTDTIRGNCEVQFKSKMNGVNTLLLDLLKFKIDSIKQNNSILSYSYSDQVTLSINLLSAMQAGDSSAVTVYYHGKPVSDATSFGGFYFQSGIAYNIGVGANYFPHMFGRAWHPCFDNFVERAAYSFHITTTSDKMAVCNGALSDSTDNGNGTITWNWSISETIPSYLSCIAVGAYVPVHLTFNGINGQVPVLLSALAADTTKMKKSFINLENAFNTFEKYYGPYKWNKIGFTAVPQSYVAMEHATNIIYPVTAMYGSTVNENLMVHELAHHWFGDQVTPRTAEDYWLKEGWAVFSEKVFFSELYGKQRYISEVAANHEQVLRCTHIFDKGYRALYPMPQNYTYGKTIYTNGADVAHTLRGYIDDDNKFFDCLKNYLQDNAYTDQDSYSFRDYLSNCSGIDLTNFFDDRVFSSGFAQFSIDTVETVQNGSMYDVTVHIRQKLNHAPHYFHQVPMDITFMNENWQTETQKVMISGPCTVFNTTLDFKPSFTCLDLNEKISDATTENYKTIKTTGVNNFIYGKMIVTVNTITDSVFLRIEHNFAAPDSLKHPIKNLHLSQQRYWKVDGIFSSGFDASASLEYNGIAPSIPTSDGSFYLDNKLITTTEDSLVLMYRPSFSSDWKIETDVVIKTGTTKSDRKGNITINHLRKGEYTLAVYQYNKIDSVINLSPDTCFSISSVRTINNDDPNITVYPNPAKDNFTVEGWLTKDCRLEVFNLTGQCVYQSNLSRGFIHQLVKAESFGKSIFMVRITDNNNISIVKKQVLVD